MSDNYFGIRLNILRKKKKLNQAQLAKILNVSQRIVSNWEKGEAMPQIATIDKIAMFFNVAIEYFFGYDYETQELIKKYKAQVLLDIENNKDSFECYTFNKLFIEYKKAETITNGTSIDNTEAFQDAYNKKIDFDIFVFNMLKNEITKIKPKPYSDFDINYFMDITRKANNN